MRRLLMGGTVAAAALLATAGLPARGQDAGPGPQVRAPCAGCGAGSRCEAGSPLEAMPAEPGPFGRLDPATARLLAGAVLAAQETVLGIRPDQANAWRAYASALIDVIPDGRRAERWTAPGAATSAGPFDLTQDVADAMIERAEKGRRLGEAIAALKPLLTPEQLERAQQMQARLLRRLVRFAELRGMVEAGPH